MDKNKSRTDLLAAGRKKLQQYRQKKDSKGSSSHGKSSKISNKCEQHESDAGGALTTVTPEGLQQVLEEEILSHADSSLKTTDSSMLHSLENSGALELSPSHVIPETVMAEFPLSHNAETPLSHKAETDLEGAGVHENKTDSSNSNEGESTHIIDNKVTGEAPSLISDMRDSEGENKHDDTLVSAESTDNVAVSAETASVNMEDGRVSLPFQEDFPDLCLIPAKGDQVTDVGAMQEADGLDSKQSGGSCVPELEGDRRLALPDHGEVAETGGVPSEQIGVEQKTSQVNHTNEADDVSAPVNMTDNSDGVLASSLAVSEADGELGAIHEGTNQQEEVAIVDTHNVEKLEMASASGYCGIIKEIASNQLDLPEESLVFVDSSQERPMLNDTSISSRGYSKSTLGDVFSTDFSQLIEVIKGLSEDEYRLLLESRSSFSNTPTGTGSVVSQRHGFPGLLERLREELFIASCTNAILHLHLSEHDDLQMDNDKQLCQMDHEISMLHISLKEAHERGDYLTKELADCQSELWAAVSQREELQHQFHAAKAGIEEFSARAYELQNSLEGSQSDVLSLSKESADGKNLVAGLQEEVANLNRSLASLTEERKQLVEEKDSWVHENDKLLKELADYEKSVAALQLEISNLSGTLFSVTEQREIIEGENEQLASWNEKLSTELSDCKGLVEALQVENAGLSGNVALVTEERKQLEEDKKYSIHESERLSSELRVLHERLSKDNEVQMRFEAQLKEMTGRLEELMEENIFLHSSLDIHKAKIREIEDRQAQISSPICQIMPEVGKLEVESSSWENAIANDLPCRPSGKPDGESMSDELSGGQPPDPFELEVLKGHLDEAMKLLQKLEVALEGMHACSVSLSRSSGEVTAPAVSKLIQAFESQVHYDDHEVEDKLVTVDRSPETGEFASTKEHTGNLKAVLKQLALDAEHARMIFKLEQERCSVADLAIRELKGQFDALKDHNDDLEATNVELVVLYEAVKQHVSIVKEKLYELEVLCESLKQQDDSLKTQNCQLGKKLCKHELIIEGLQSQLHELQQSSDVMVFVLRDQLENVQKEAAERELAVEQEWNSRATHVLDAVERLDFVGLTIPDDHSGSLDIVSHVSAYVNASNKMIADLKQKLEVACNDHEATLNLFKEVNEKCGKNEVAFGMLDRLYCELREIVINYSWGSAGEIEVRIQDERLPDLVDYSRYKALIEQLEDFLAERLQLQSLNNKLNLELMNRTKDVEELSTRGLDLSSMQRLIEDIEVAMPVEDRKMDTDRMPVSHLESLVSLLVCKYKEADSQVSLSREEIRSKVLELTELQEKMDQLTAMELQHETEILLLKERLSQEEEALIAVQSEFQEKVTEHEQSEQRLSSLREKLSMAVAKGKGLVVQRDCLKQSLAETASELERCSQELQLKNAQLQEMETKIKTYSEAGERVEALESELSYIRNSATALRESFLLKDSILQRIEEILEDLDLPEHFHSKDIIEKVDWLARSGTGNSLPVIDWDQKSSAEGSYSDAGLVIMDAWKGDVQPSSNSGDDLRRKYEEVQNKFYGLAEQNEMLEQSLVERNNLVQRWEELLTRINIPSHLRSMEPEDRIEWLGSALSDANNDKDFLLQKIDKLENYCGSLNADLEESQKRISSLNMELEDSQKRISGLQMELQAAICESEKFSEKLEILNLDHEKASAKAAQFELDKEKLQNEVSGLQEKLAEKLGNEECIQEIDDKVNRLQDLICDALQDSTAAELFCGGSSAECLEGLLRKLIENYKTLSLRKPLLVDAVEENHSKNSDADLVEGRTRDTLDSEESDVALLKRESVEGKERNVDALERELKKTLSELIDVREERDRCVEKQQSLLFEVDTLGKRSVELQELLTQEEQKSILVREKLNVAVRKGKSLIQQRDNLKQTIEEMTSELEHLKSEIKLRESALAESEQKMRDLTAYSKRIEVLESESLFLRNRLAETEHALQEKGHTLNLFSNAMGGIDVGAEIDNSDPIQKLEYIGKLCHDLCAAVASSEQESRKSGRAMELLLAELNEVQDRNDGLQEELARATDTLTELSKEKDTAEAAKLEALSNLEKLSTVQLAEKKKLYSDLAMLKLAADELLKGFSLVKGLLADIFSKELEFLQDLGSSLQNTETNQVVQVPLFHASDVISSSSSEDKENFLSRDFVAESYMPDHFDDNFIVEVYSSVEEAMKEISSIKIKLREHSVALPQQASVLSKLVGMIHSDITSQKESLEAMKQDIKHIESIEKEKEKEIVALHRNVVLLYEACTSSILEIENRKDELLGNALAADSIGLMNLKPAILAYGGRPSGGGNTFLIEEHIRSVSERLLLVVKDFAGLKGEIVEGNKEEMKITISNLQKELQEKDIQRERICTDLVSQIKEAQAAVTSHLQDLQYSRSRVYDLEKKLEMMEEERTLLEQRIKELQDGRAISAELQERLQSLTDVLAAKDQEIEALMRALDEEEVQMEDLTKKVKELEKVVQQKNSDIEYLEAFRGKILKKLSITVSKFDELHHFSESLLVEVENLQSQLQDRDAEVSFLRHEVTRCTTDALVASQLSGKRNSDEILELLTWLDTLVAQAGIQDVDLDDGGQHEYKEILQKKIISILSKVEDLRMGAQSMDALLQTERSKVEELTQKIEMLKKSVYEKESQLNLLEGVEDLRQPTTAASEILEVEPVINKWTVPGPSTSSQVRSLRKVNNDQVAIAIDMDPGSSSRLEDEDDDKVHGFKSLTTSRIVPKFTRRVSDMIDGLWVSCDRALMRQPALRFGIIIYWVIIHALVATFVV